MSLWMMQTYRCKKRKRERESQSVCVKGCERQIERSGNDNIGIINDVVYLYHLFCHFHYSANKSAVSVYQQWNIGISFSYQYTIRHINEIYDLSRGFHKNMLIESTPLHWWMKYQRHKFGKYFTWKTGFSLRDRHNFSGKKPSSLISPIQLTVCILYT